MVTHCIKSFLRESFSLFKSMIGDIIFAYKQLLHWNISKICISFSSYLMGILFSAPFFLLAFIIIALSDYSLVNIINDLISVLHPLSQSFGGFDGALFSVFILFFFGLGILFIGSTYSRVLLARLHFSYIKNEKMGIRNNAYFDFRLFLKYLKLILSLVVIFFLFSLSIVFIFGVMVLMFSFLIGYEELISQLNSGGVNFISILMAVLLFVVSVAFIYLSFRLSFSYLVLSNNPELSIRDCIRESFTKTKKIVTLYKFLFIGLFFIVLTMPIVYLGSYIDFQTQNIEKYIDLKNKISSYNGPEVGEVGKDTTLQEKTIYSQLSVKYQMYSDRELVGKYQKLYILQIVYFIFYFIIIYGMFDLIMAAFFKRELK